MKKTYAFDIECLKNLFTATFVNVEDETDKHVFYVGLDKPDTSDIKNFLKQSMTLTGYNNDSYDSPMLRFLMYYRGSEINKELYNLSSKLTDDNFRSDKDIMELRYPRKHIASWNTVDLMRILAFDKLGISLKQTAINLKWHKIQDMPVFYGDNVNQAILGDILDYNLNDVLITKRLHEEITPLRELRRELSNLYHVDLTSASDSRMANLILEHIYENELRTDIRSIRNMRTPREKVLLGKCIAKFVSFETPQLQELFDRISCAYVYEYANYQYSEKISYANNVFALGIGGLHTEDEAGIFETDDDYIIQDMDVASYYPNLIINNNFYPEHLGEGFIQVLKKITSERMAAKKEGDKVKADGLKITINSIFGKMGSKDFWLYDPKQMLSTTISGQLGLLMLVEQLSLAKIPVISCNTDGIVCKIPRNLESKYYEIAKDWEKKTGLELEFTTYKKYVRRDVNNYITEKSDGKTKEKGIFLTEVDLKKSYHMPIVAKALYNYYIKNIPIRDTLEGSRDIMDFCISQKTGGDFQMELHTLKGVEKLQKTNRFFVSKKGGGALIKKSLYSSKQVGLYVGNLVTVLNEYKPEVPFADYHVDLSFYEKEVMKIVDMIEPKQMKLFDMTLIGESHMTKLPIPKQVTFREKIKNNVFDLNTLGKNQLSRKIKAIVDNDEVIEGISPRYVYIERFDSKSMTADIYCLAKGIRQTLGVNKKAYFENKIQQGQLVYCVTFEKTKYGHSVVKYNITEKIDEEKEEIL